jgi:hypothetical protein
VVHNASKRLSASKSLLKDHSLKRGAEGGAESAKTRVSSASGFLSA